MTRFINFTHRKSKTKTRKERSKNVVQGPMAFYVILSLVIVVGLSYLVFVNKVATDGYQVKALSERIDTLKTDYKGLELEASGLQSMSSINELSESLNLVSISQMDYLSSSGTVVAYK